MGSGSTVERSASTRPQTLVLEVVAVGEAPVAMAGEHSNGPPSVPRCKALLTAHPSKDTECRRIPMSSPTGVDTHTLGRQDMLLLRPNKVRYYSKKEREENLSLTKLN